MIRSVLLRGLHPETAVQSACTVPGGGPDALPELCVCTPSRLSFWHWDRERGRAAVGQELCCHSRLLHAAAFSCGPDGQQAVLVLGESAAWLYSRAASGKVALVQTAALGVGAGAATRTTLPRPIFSNVLTLSRLCTVMAFSLHEETLQLISVIGDEEGLSLHVTTGHLGGLVSAEEGDTLVVESLAVTPSTLPTHARHSCCVAVLYTAYGAAGMGSEKCVACLDADESGALKPGPWFIRNLNPTTTLLHATGGSQPGADPSGECGVLVASSAGLLLVPSTAPRGRRPIQCSLAGVPASVAALGAPSRHLLGDSQGRLYLVDLGQARVEALQLSGATAAPSGLAFLGGWSDPAAAAGLLFVGSQAGASSFVEVPWPAVRPSPAPPGPAVALPASQHSRSPAPQLCWEVLPLEAAGLDSLAPVRDALMIAPDGGCEDERLLVSCGNGPSGRLALARWAAGLVPLASGGPAMPGRVRLVGLRESLAARHHRYLLLSSDVSPATTALDVGGTRFQEACIPGLQLDQATLACSPTAGGYLVQVTAQGAYTIRPSSGELVATWPCAVSLAAVHRQYVALASGSSVYCLHVSGATGRLQAERELQLEQQVSALALFELGLPDSGQEASDLLVAAGQWVSNELVLHQLSADAPACRLSLGDRQPRSVAACCLLPHAQHLFVGTSTGELMWWEVQSTAGPFGAASVRLSPRQWVRVGAAPVELQLMRPSAPPPLPPAPNSGGGNSENSSSGSGGSRSTASQWMEQQPCLLASSDQLLIVSAAAPEDPTGLAVLRLHGAGSPVAVCPISTAELPPHSLAWVSAAGRLHVGRLDGSLGLRWDAVPLGATPALTAYHPPSCCAAVAACEAGGRYSLRLVELGGEPAEVARLPMAEGHAITALCVAPLQCSGASGAAGGGGGACMQSACKDFLLVATCLERPAQPSTPGARWEAQGQGLATGSAGQPQGSEDGSGGMWWRAGGSNAWQHAPPGGGAAEEVAADLQPDASPALHGLLSVFEIRRRRRQQQQQQQQQQDRGPPASGSCRPSLELVLHGTCPLDTVLYSLAAVIPDPVPFSCAPPHSQQQQQPQSPAGGAAAAGPATQRVPLLAAGCPDGLRLYRVFVDDAGVEGLAEVEQSLQSISVTEPLQFGRGCGQQRPVEAGREGAHPAPDVGGPALSRLWHQHVALQLIAKAPTPNDGIPASLAACGPLLFCTELFSSASVYRVRPAVAGQLPSLIPCSVDRSCGHMGAALPLPDTHLLAGFQPRGLALMRRSAATEAQAHAAAKLLHERELERGRARGQGGDEEAEEGEPLPGGGQHSRQRPGVAFVPGHADCAELEVLAACAQPHAAAAICPGQLGVKVHSLSLSCNGSDTAGLDTPAGAPPPPPAPACTQQSAVVVSVRGGVTSLHTVSEGQLQPLLQLQQALEGCEHQALLPGFLPPALHAPEWRFRPSAFTGGEEGAEEPEGAGGGGNCIDADFVSAGLAALGSLGEASRALGLPMQQLEQVRGMLRGALA